MEPIKLTTEFEREMLAAGKGISFCLPITAANSTVLGYEVDHRSRMWRGLDWSGVRIDSGPHFFHGEASQYLHVDFMDDGERLSYRVRSRLRLGDKVKVVGVLARLSIDEIEVAGLWNGKWQWRYHAK